MKTEEIGTQITESHGNLLKRGVVTAGGLGDGLFCITDSEALAVLPCQPLEENQEFQSYSQLSQGPRNCK